MTPYKVTGVFRVHRQDIQKILFCSFPGNHDCHLFTICGVVFQNGVRWPAHWRQDSQTGSFAVFAEGRQVGIQGGYLGYIPNRQEDGIFHYEYSNPFRY